MLQPREQLSGPGSGLGFVDAVTCLRHQVPQDVTPLAELEKQKNAAVFLGDVVDPNHMALRRGKCLCNALHGRNLRVDLCLDTTAGEVLTVHDLHGILPSGLQACRADDTRKSTSAQIWILHCQLKLLGPPTRQ